MFAVSYMNAIEQCQAELMPRMEALVSYLSQGTEMLQHGFFTEIYGMLGAAN